MCTNSLAKNISIWRDQEVGDPATPSPIYIMPTSEGNLRWDHYYIMNTAHYLWDSEKHQFPPLGRSHASWLTGAWHVKYQQDISGPSTFSPANLYCTRVYYSERRKSSWHVTINVCLWGNLKIAVSFTYRNHIYVKAILCSFWALPCSLFHAFYMEYRLKRRKCLLLYFMHVTWEIDLPKLEHGCTLVDPFQAFYMEVRQKRLS